MNKSGDEYNSSTPAWMKCGKERELSIWTLNILSKIKDLIMLMICIGILKFIILYSRPSYQTMSNAFWKPKKTDAVLSLLMADLASSSIRPVNLAVVECPWQKTNCSYLMIRAVNFLRRINIRISSNFTSEFKREICLWFNRIVLFFPGLGIIITLACFHGVGKCSNWRQQLNILVICKIVFCFEE